MKKELGVFTGKTVGDAVLDAAAKAGVSKDEIIFDVLEQGKAGFLGIGAVKAEIKAYVEDKSTDGERAVAFLQGLFPLLGIEGEPVLVKEDKKIEIDVQTKNYQSVVGKRGVLLDALQSLAGAVANIGRDDYKRVVVDCENYRQKREETLKKVANKTADKAVRQGRKISLEPMSAYERRIIHAALAEHPDVKTVSEGKEPRRFVVVIPNELKPFNPRRDGQRGGRGGRGSRGSFNRGERRDSREGGREQRPRRTYTEEEMAARSQVGGGTGMGAGASGAGYKKSSSMVFGTFLGNSLKDENNGESEE